MLQASIPSSSGRTARDRADLDIGIIYTHERDFMGPLVESLARSGPGLSMRLVLVDNVSGDGVDRWCRAFDRTVVVKNAHRLHYAANLNRILQASTARYVLLLNTDMLFEPDVQCLTKMMRFMDATPDCGLAACRLYHTDGGYGFPARRYQTLSTIAARRMPWGDFARGTVRRYLYADRSHYTAFDCQWVSGCFMFLRRETLEDVGLFDEGFGKYFEDVDYCLRVARAGWRVMLNGACYAYHFEQRASKSLFSPDAMKHLRSYARWWRKWGRDPWHALAANRRPTLPIGDQRAPRRADAA
ncbi:MAG TPA: glycosyltransferase [Pirellulales bacterium]|nr:glycosyltransferase [Pirellulales bacterium]